MDFEIDWIRPNVSLCDTAGICKLPVSVVNSGDLSKDFNNYARDFFEAAESVMYHLDQEAALKGDIGKLDLFYFAMIYLYRQSLELSIKASIFQVVTVNSDRKRILGEIRHDLEKGYRILFEVKEKDLGHINNNDRIWLLKFLADISLIDKESDMFRYPFGNGMQTLFGEQTHISLKATYANMSKAYKILENIYTRESFEEIGDEDYLPKLIIEGGEYYQQSVVGYKYSESSFYPYFSSYEKVGNLLKNEIIDKGKTNLFMPMCYMYRNAVELGLKRLIVEDIHIESAKVSKILRRKKHSILGLWNSIISEIERYARSSEDDNTLDHVAEYMSMFHNFDKKSDIFRYPCDKNLKSYFLEEQEFDVYNVSLSFKELCNFLDGVDSMLKAINDMESDMLSYSYE